MLQSCSFDDFDVDGLVKVAARFGTQRYGYVVTPNADHLIRLHEEPALRPLYEEASYVTLDSRFIARLLRLLRGTRLPVCPGSDLTARLFAEVIHPDDRIVLIGGGDGAVSALRRRYRLTQLAHYNPPMGFIHDPAAVEACMDFIEAHSPFRYCLLGVGSPQQERLALMLKERGRARGLALCVGASINFLTGGERRAPHWMQQAGLEWLFRLLQSPRRLAYRYLVRGPRIFPLLYRLDFRLRPPAAPAVAASAVPPTAVETAS